MKKSIDKTEYHLKYTFRVTIGATSDQIREQARLTKALGYAIRTCLTDDFQVELRSVKRRRKA